LFNIPVNLVFLSVLNLTMSMIAGFISRPY